MITNGLTPVFGSEPLSWGTFGVLFDPPRFGLFILSLPLDDALETHACLLQNTSMDALCGPPCGGLGVILSRLAPFCLFRGQKSSGSRPTPTCAQYRTPHLIMPACQWVCGRLRTHPMR